jgi:hypothetical protein
VQVWLVASQVWHALALQLPQSSVPPQPSEMLPQVALRSAQVFGVQQVPASHDCPLAQVELQVWLVASQLMHALGSQLPQSSEPPQPSDTMPQSTPAVQVVGVQHWLWKQTWPLVQAETQVLVASQVWHALPLQVPQWSVPPQSSEMLPQVAPWAVQVVGVQQVPLKQVWPAGQLQVSVFPQSPFGIAPHFGACVAQVVGVQQFPNRGLGFPGRGAGIKQSRLQQLMLVTHC